MTSKVKQFKFTRDAILSALSIAAAGALILVASADLPVGTTAAIGPGFFPKSVGVLLLIVSVLSACLDTAPANPDESAKIDLRSLFFISLAIIVFMVANDALGLFPAVIFTVFISSLASQTITMRQRLIVSLFGGLFAVVVFIYLLNLNFSVVRGIF